MITRVSNIVKINLQKFFEDYVMFITQGKQYITDYYIKNTTYPKSSFDALYSLKKESRIILDKISSNRDYLINFSDFEVVDQLETVIHCLEIIDNYSRWMRSSLFNGKFKQSAEIDVILKQHQTLESFATEAGYVDKDQGAIDIALRNNLKEIHTTLDGGVIFRFNYYDNNKLLLNSVIDNLNGDNLLGKDIKKKITFGVDDILTLEPSDTFAQSCEILISLLKGDNPEFPYVGFDKSTLINKSTINTMLPSYIRQLYSMVFQDDSISNFNVSNIYMNNDRLNIDIIFKSWLNNEVKQIVNGN